ncbi:MAG: hypothetical protein IKY83_07635, partial [Proteobacteria bacterium]|nr:hypothetical protein [Pseudomonadota bacterium]
MLKRLMMISCVVLVSMTGCGREFYINDGCNVDDSYCKDSEDGDHKIGKRYQCVKAHKTDFFDLDYKNTDFSDSKSADATIWQLAATCPGLCAADAIQCACPEQCKNGCDENGGCLCPETCANGCDETGECNQVENCKFGVEADGTCTCPESCVNGCDDKGACKCDISCPNGCDVTGEVCCRENCQSGCNSSGGCLCPENCANGCDANGKACCDDKCKNGCELDGSCSCPGNCIYGCNDNGTCKNAEGCQNGIDENGACKCPDQCQNGCDSIGATCACPASCVGGCNDKGSLCTCAANCVEGSSCDTSTGKCSCIDKCKAGCNDAGDCEAACEGIECKANELCKAGKCVDPCKDVTCEHADEFCKMGDCVPVDANHNHMHDQYETAKNQGMACRKYADCNSSDDLEDGFCDSFIGYRCSTKCTTDDQCLDDGEYHYVCRSDGRCAPDAFVTVWNFEDEFSSMEKLVLSTRMASECDLTIDWGDGKQESFKCSNWECDDLEHSYEQAGQYTVTIKGTLEGFGFSWSCPGGGACGRYPSAEHIYAG